VHAAHRPVAGAGRQAPRGAAGVGFQGVEHGGSRWVGAAGAGQRHAGGAASSLTAARMCMAAGELGVRKAAVAGALRIAFPALGINDRATLAAMT
jgi:hypothetical protein